MIRLVCAMALVACVHGGAQANDGTVRYDVANFDVAGIKLGMNPDEVRAAMKSHGFDATESAFPTSTTFSGLVQQEARRLGQRPPKVPVVEGPGEIAGEDNGRNRLVVTFLSTSRGPVASTVTLTFNTDTNDMRLLERDVVARYGKPSRRMLSSNGSHWCDKKGAAKCDLFGDPKAPKLEFVPAVLTKLRLTNWQSMTSQRKDEIASFFSKPDGSRQRSLLGGG